MKRYRILPLILSIVILLTGCAEIKAIDQKLEQTTSVTVQSVDKYEGSAYITLNNNIPNFDKADYTTESFETYGELDYLGRCTVAYACVGTDIMPTEKRGNIGSVKPTGWQSVKYNNVDGGYLYNRCHLIGYQLTAENANERNLITGTRYMNVDGMLTFEDIVADYVKDTGNHVLYRVTPDFRGENLLANGVQMEAYSVEDSGKGVCFNVYCYNVQPDIEIDYATGMSTASDSLKFDEGETKQIYIINTSTKKFHRASCKSVSDIKEENKKQYKGYRSSLINNGFVPCGNCKP